MCNDKNNLQEPAKLLKFIRYRLVLEHMKDISWRLIVNMAIIHILLVIIPVPHEIPILQQNPIYRFTSVSLIQKKFFFLIEIKM